MPYTFIIFFPSCVLHIFHQNKIVSPFLWDKLCWAQWEDEKYFLEVYSPLFFDSMAIIHNSFSSVLTSSTLFFLSHIVAYFSVTCHLFKKKYCSLCPCCYFSSPQDKVMCTFRLWFVTSACSSFEVCSFTITAVYCNVDQFSVLPVLLFMGL